MTQPQQKIQPFSDPFVVKSSQIPFTSLIVKHLDMAAGQAKLESLIAEHASFFVGGAFCLDVSQVSASPEQLRQWVGMMRAQGMVVFAVRSAEPSLQSCISDLQLSSLSPAAVHPESDKHKRPGPYGNKVVSQVRSGQQLYAKDQSLVVLGNVNEGAEVLADGDIHIYGQLRGRALAGVQGQTQAQIFCQQITQAELIAVAGVYMLNDQFRDHQGLAIVGLENDQIIIKSH